MEVELMVTKRDDNRPTDNRVNIEQSASGRLEGRVLQYLLTSCAGNIYPIVMGMGKYCANIYPYRSGNGENAHLLT